MHAININLLWSLQLRYRTISKKVGPMPSFLSHTRRSRNPKLGLFEGRRRFRGPQKPEEFNFSKHTNKSVDYEFKSFAIN